MFVHVLLVNLGRGAIWAACLAPVSALARPRVPSASSGPSKQSSERASAAATGVRSGITSCDDLANHHLKHGTVCWTIS